MSKSSSSLGSDYYSKWNDASFCGCPASNYVAIKIEWNTHSMGQHIPRVLWNCTRGISAIFTFGLSTKLNGGLEDLTHDAICIRIRCKKCCRTIPLTCEFVTNGQQFRWGHYQYCVSTRKEVEIDLDYLIVKETFESMPRYSYDLLAENCKHWADRFYNNLIIENNKEQKRKEQRRREQERKEKERKEQERKEKERKEKERKKEENK
ncbi:hypothetical protein Mgra_00008653, partial [Meloidogyne graminicola]